ncbi:glycoside hydrolase family 13 protein [Enterovibrio paralichthyis]|uniref:glycoside hydrolase family 13 protein n=1 Tax=Enterovibrio paralichthyis TaxID=2853805 RepID=UPI001C438907|nr:alpha-glucosidase [Enterovibrio paralichthyis]MBV7299162.1 alpha-glucosidase [Enterovibrio paralichthyis]
MHTTSQANAIYPANNPWWHNAVVYQIYPRSFCDSNGDGIGDIQGIISKLDYLKTLGVNVIWLSPVYKSPMDDNGYDISDYQDIAPEFGTLADMDELLAKARDRGIRIIMDLVVNHTSDEHRWFEEAKKGKDNPFRDYYIWRKPNEDGSAPDDQGSLFGGSAWQYDEASGEYYFHLFSKKQPDLNWENPKVQEEVHQMMNWWIDRGIGGFRMDVIDLIGKEIDKGITGNGPRLHPLLQQMNRATFGDKDLLTVGETWGATPEIAKLYSDPAREELSMVFQFEHITLTWGNGDKWTPVPLELPTFKAVLTKWQTELADNGWNSLFWNNHDLPRVVSKYGCDGEHRVKSAKMLATAMHLLKGTPYIYQGEEIGMTNVAFDTIEEYRDIETLNFYRERTENGVSPEAMMAAIHENSRDNARTPMQWSASTHGGFTEGTPWIQANPNHTEINVDAALTDTDSVFWHYKHLVEMRQQHPVIVYGSFTPLFAEHPSLFGYVRELDGVKIVAINNFSADTITVDVPAEWQIGGECLVHNGVARSALEQILTLTPYESFAILVK